MSALRRLWRRLRRRNRYQPREWCGVCGDEIAAGWAIHEVMAPTGEELYGGGTVMSAFFCRDHRPDDERAVRWPS